MNEAVTVYCVGVLQPGNPAGDVEQAAGELPRQAQEPGYRSPRYQVGNSSR